MTDKPRKPLSLKPKATATTENAPQATRRGKKRIIKRDDLPAAKLASTKKPPPKPAKKKPKSSAPKTPIISPSEKRLENLNASLNGLDVWREFKPLALGIKKQIFQHIAKHQLSASKRVVQKLLQRHTKNRMYLLAIRAGGSRYNLDAKEVGIITQIEKIHAGHMLTTLSK